MEKITRDEFAEEWLSKIVAMPWASGQESRRRKLQVLSKSLSSRPKLHNQVRYPMDMMPGLGKKDTDISANDALREKLRVWLDDECYRTAPVHHYSAALDLEPLLEAKTKSTGMYRCPCAEDEKVCVFERSASGNNNKDGALQFHSRFESGNLERVMQVGPFEFELYLQSDPGGEKPQVQWFYFAVQGFQTGVQYRFNLMNFTKGESLFGNHGGCRPLCYSTQQANKSRQGWHRVGEDVLYLPNSAKRFTLSFTVCFERSNVEEDLVYFAPCYPYRYSDLQRHLDSLEEDPCRSSRLRRELLCRTLAGNRCDLVTVTSFGDQVKVLERPIIILTARVHPGESNASWVMKGILDYLTGPTLYAKLLRDCFVFQIVPMLNPDGVILGNSRCSLAGVDLNRMYSEPDKKLHPTIWHLKNLILQLSRNSKVVLYCDIHGHSRRHNIFAYGCEERKYRRLAKLCTTTAANTPAEINNNNNNNDENETSKKGEMLLEVPLDLDSLLQTAQEEEDPDDPEIEDEDDDANDVEMEDAADVDAEVDPDADGDEGEECSDVDVPADEGSEIDPHSQLQNSLQRDLQAPKSATQQQQQPQRQQLRPPKSTPKKRGKRTRRKQKVGRKLASQKSQQAREEARRIVARVRTLPKLLSDACALFVYKDCSYKIQRYKESTGRVCVHRESRGEILSYTLEASLGGLDSGPLAGNHLNHLHYEGMGHGFCAALLDFSTLELAKGT